MKLSALMISGLANRDRSLTFQSGRVVLRGPVGAGKTTIHNAIKLALLLPTAPSSQLSRLSPTGQWSIDLRDDAANVSLRRTQNRDRAQYALNGQKATADEYQKAVAGIISVEPHHVDLQSFLDLSGQKRAAMFTELLEGGDTTTIAALLGQPLLAFFQITSGIDTIPSWLPDLSKPDTLHNLLQTVNSAATEASRRSRDAQTRLDDLMRKSVTAPARSQGELGAAAAAINQKIGELKHRKADMESAKQRVEAAEKLVKGANDRLNKAKQAVADIEHCRTALQQLQSSLESAERTFTQMEDLRKSKGLVSAEKNAAESHARLELASVQAVARAMVDILKAEWKLDPEWLEAEIDNLGSAGVLHSERPENSPELLLNFARECMAEFLEHRGGREALTAAQDALRIASDAHAATSRDFETAVAMESDARKAVEKIKGEIAKAEERLGTLPTLEAQMRQAEAEVAETTRKMAEVSVADDAAIVDAEIKRLSGDLAQINADIQAHQDALSINGSREEQRLAMTLATGTGESLKLLASRIQQRRDAELKEKLEKCTKPFRECAALFFDDARVDPVITGQGRSTEMTFTLLRKGIAVPLEMLSSGEMVMMQAAFLAALQSIKGTPGSILMADLDAMDEACMERFLEGAKKLPIDFICVATNKHLRPAGGKEIVASEGWEVIEV